MDGGRGGDGWKQWVEEAMEVDGMLEVMQELEVEMLQVALGRAGGRAQDRDGCSYLAAENQTE